MYEQFSERVERVVKEIAPAIAREYELDYVGTEHLLLAIEREGTGVGAVALRERGVDGAGLRAEVDRLVKNSIEDTWVFGRLPGTPHFRNVMAAAIEQARKLGSKEVCTEHLLLALLKEKGSVAGTALRNLKISYADVRARVLQGDPSSADYARAARGDRGRICQPQAVSPSPFSATDRGAHGAGPNTVRHRTCVPAWHGQGPPAKRTQQVPCPSPR